MLYCTNRTDNYASRLVSTIAVTEPPVLYEGNWMMRGVVSECISYREDRDAMILSLKAKLELIRLI